VSNPCLSETQRLAHKKQKHKHTRQHWNLDYAVQYFIVVIAAKQEKKKKTKEEKKKMAANKQQG
jgi:hypothetical protein